MHTLRRIAAIFLVGVARVVRVWNISNLATPLIGCVTFALFDCYGGNDWFKATVKQWRRARKLSWCRLV